MPLIQGSRLPERLKQEVLDAFPRRFTVENAQARGQCPACMRVWSCVLLEGHATDHPDLLIDALWLEKYAFQVTRGGHLDLRLREGQVWPR